MTSNRLPNGQQIGLLELQVLGVIGRHWAWSRACLVGGYTRSRMVGRHRERCGRLRRM